MSHHVESKSSKKRVKELPTEEAKEGLVGDSTYRQIKRELSELRDKATSAAEQEYLEEYLRLFVTNRRIIRLFERKLLNDPLSRDVYALMTLYSQQREIINDIRMISDLGGQVELLHTYVLRPYTSSLTQAVSDVYYQLRTLISQTCKKDTQFALEQLSDLTRQLGVAINAGQSIAITELNRIMLGGEPEKKPSRKKR